MKKNRNRKRRPARPDDRETQWFAAAQAGSRADLEALIADGIDVNVRDSGGRTALFYVLAPFGGNPELAMWLVGRGVDVNARDRKGDSALEYGGAHCSSGAEASMLAHLRDAFVQRGYRHANPPAPVKPLPRRQTIEHYLGSWGIAEGQHTGARFEVRRDAIATDFAPLRLAAAKPTMHRARLELDGDHEGLPIRVTLSLLPNDRGRLRWSDGVTYDADYLIERPPG